MSATALSWINSHRAAEQMIHVVIPIRIESAISSNHQLEDAIVFFMSICLTGFLPFLIESIMQISVYISPWMIAWPAFTPKCRRGGDSKVQWCQSLLITEVPHCMSENEYKLRHFSKSHYGAYFPVNYSSQVPFLQRENWWNLLTYRPIPKSTPRSLCDHSVMHFLLLIGLNYSPSWQ